MLPAFFLSRNLTSENYIQLELATTLPQPLIFTIFLFANLPGQRQSAPVRSVQSFSPLVFTGAASKSNCDRDLPHSLTDRTGMSPSKLVNWNGLGNANIYIHANIYISIAGNVQNVLLEKKLMKRCFLTGKTMKFTNLKFESR